MKLKLYLTAAFLACVSAFALQGKGRVYDRGYDMKSPAAIIAPKGSWSLGGSIGYGITRMDNYDILFIKGITSNSHFVLVDPQFVWHFADNMGFGVRCKYKRNYLAIDSAKATIAETSISVTNYNYLSHNYGGELFYRYYLPFGKSGHFAGFADLGIGAGGTATNVVDKDGRGGYGTGWNISAGAKVGALALLTKHLGIDVRLGLLEVTYNSVSQENNVGSSTEQKRVYGSGSTVSTNFMIDLFTLSFGVHYYL